MHKPVPPWWRFDQRAFRTGLANRPGDEPLDDRIGQQLPAQAKRCLIIQFPFDQVAGSGRNGQIRPQTQIDGLGGNSPRGPIGLPFSRINIDFPQRHGSFGLR